MSTSNDIDRTGDPGLVLFTDMSLTSCGEGARLGRTGGHRDTTDNSITINIPELKLKRD